VQYIIDINEVLKALYHTLSCFYPRHIFEILESFRSKKASN
jgi:hypothetical protein